MVSLPLKASTFVVEFPFNIVDCFIEAVITIVMCMHRFVNLSICHAVNSKQINQTEITTSHNMFMIYLYIMLTFRMYSRKCTGFVWINFPPDGYFCHEYKQCNFNCIRVQINIYKRLYNFPHLSNSIQYWFCFAFFRSL